VCGKFYYCRHRKLRWHTKCPTHFGFRIHAVCCVRLPRLRIERTQRRAMSMRIYREQQLVGGTAQHRQLHTESSLYRFSRMTPGELVRPARKMAMVRRRGNSREEPRLSNRTPNQPSKPRDDDFLRAKSTMASPTSVAVAPHPAAAASASEVRHIPTPSSRAGRGWGERRSGLGRTWRRFLVEKEEPVRAWAARRRSPVGSDPRVPGIGSVCVFSFVRRMRSGAGAVRFPWFDYFRCELRISLGAIYEFL